MPENKGNSSSGAPAKSRRFFRRHDRAKLGARDVTVILTDKSGRAWVRDNDNDNFICRVWQLS